jgi:hypothetical protein
VIAMTDMKGCRRAAMAGLVGIGLAFAGVSAVLANDDDEDTFEQKIIKGILGGLGVDVGRPGIEYRERSPLVVPPSRDLPAPEDAATVQTNPAWPRDQEVRRAREARAKDRTPLSTIGTPEEPGQSRRMTPEELRRGAIPGAGRVTDPKTGSINDIDQGRPLRPSELGNTKSLFSLDSLLGGHKPEQSTFSGEPPRTALTQPPPGYQTPSAAQPYGIGEDKKGPWRIPTIFDRPVGKD